MCEFLAFLMVLFGCNVCDSNGETNLSIRGCNTNELCIDLQNDVPVRGVQFTLEYCSPESAETTYRTEGFFAKVNNKNGTVICVSLSGAKIKPGVGAILRIIFDEGQSQSCLLSQIKISE